MRGNLVIYDHLNKVNQLLNLFFIRGVFRFCPFTRIEPFCHSAQCRVLDYSQKIEILLLGAALYQGQEKSRPCGNTDGPEETQFFSRMNSIAGLEMK